MGIGIEKEVLSNWACALNCVVGEIPFVYLGLPIGAKPSDKQVWNKVVERVEKGWRNGKITIFLLEVD